ncbi:MAG: hypothetical protein V2A73_19460 [Pseudomonadota bacterium]
MDQLADLDPPTTVRERKKWQATLVDQKTGQSLLLRSDAPMTSYCLDRDDLWADGERKCDTVLIVEAPSLVCFVEFKGCVSDKRFASALEQLEGAMHHFARSEPHGADHHSRWENGEDLPHFLDARRMSCLALRAHRVLGAIIGKGGGTRKWPPKQVRLGTMKALVLTLPSRWRKGQPPRPLSDFLKDLGLTK